MQRGPILLFLHECHTHSIQYLFLAVTAAVRQTKHVKYDYRWCLHYSLLPPLTAKNHFATDNERRQSKSPLLRAATVGPYVSTTVLLFRQRRCSGLCFCSACL